MRKYNCFLFSALCLAMMGCHSMKEERHDHEHEHEGMEEHICMPAKKNMREKFCFMKNRHRLRVLR